MSRGAEFTALCLPDLRTHTHTHWFVTSNGGKNRTPINALVKYYYY